jgi:3-oxoacyl-[acyl-carrier-protein] synthase-3
MIFTNVVVESFAYALSENELTSDAIETTLKPLYDKLKLPEGRLELMTGIKSRRMWEPGT